MSVLRPVLVALLTGVIATPLVAQGIPRNARTTQVATNAPRLMVANPFAFAPNDSANAVQIGTANFINPRVTEEIIEGMYAYAQAEKLMTIRSIIGGLQTKAASLNPFEQPSC